MLILIADGAPGKPGRQVLKADTSLQGPRPQVLIPATLNLYAVPDNSSCFLEASRNVTVSSSSFRSVKSLGERRKWETIVFVSLVIPTSYQWLSRLTTLLTVLCEGIK